MRLIIAYSKLKKRNLELHKACKEKPYQSDPFDNPQKMHLTWQTQSVLTKTYHSHNFGPISLNDCFGAVFTRFKRMRDPGSPISQSGHQGGPTFPSRHQGSSISPSHI